MEALLRRYPRLASLPRVDLGVRVTPVEEHRVDGLRVLVKRDDLTSEAYGGNKVRSLEFLLAGRPARILTFSSRGAHHAYATAVHGARIGIPTAAVIVRKGPRGPLLARLREVSERVVEVPGAAGVLLAALRLWRPGTRVVPPGGMTPRGALGYLAAAFEIDPVPPAVYVPLGTGTTVSGLLAGFALRGVRTEVVGVRVADAAAGWPPLLWRRAVRAVEILRRHDPALPPLRRGGVRLRVVKAGGAYGEATPEALRAVRAARPLRLEPTYTGKTLAVLLGERRKGALFLHTFSPGPGVRAGSPI